MELICLDNSFTKVLKSLDIFHCGKKMHNPFYANFTSNILQSSCHITNCTLKSTADKLKHLKVAVFVQQWKVSREMEMAFASTILQEMVRQRKRSVICSAITPHN